MSVFIQEKAQKHTIDKIIGFLAHIFFLN